MIRAIDLLKQGRNEELWQMCCGFLKLDINEFMEIQNHLLLEQIELLNNSMLGLKIMHGVRPKTIEEFRERVPLTTYKDYCPELIEKREDTLPVKPLQWVRTSGKSGDYPCKWVPMTADYAEELSKTLYGIGTISGCKGWGDISNLPRKVKALYSVAPAPYISGVFAELIKLQSPFVFMPSIEEAAKTNFEERIKAGFQQAMSEGLDYFFGISLVLVSVGEKVRQSSNRMDIMPFLKSPRALWRLGRGKIRSYFERRPMLPKDLWKVKGIISSGVDSIVYKEKIQKLWGKKPLDLYSCTEGGVIAAQAWDYSDMTFVPNLNFLEFISEDEYLKYQMDRSYRPSTLLLNEVLPGNNYVLVITNFHGGILTRYIIGDMVRITSLASNKLDIHLPQMAFERRVDDIIDLFVVRLTEKTIWKSLENIGLNYVDWIAYKEPENRVLRLFLEPDSNNTLGETEIADLIYNQIMNSDTVEIQQDSPLRDEFADSIDFKIKVEFLPRGAFSEYTTKMQSQGADIAHLKPPHINPSSKVLANLFSGMDEEIYITKKSRQAEINLTAGL